MSTGPSINSEIRKTALLDRLEVLAVIKLDVCSTDLRAEPVYQKQTV